MSIFSSGVFHNLPAPVRQECPVLTGALGQSERSTPGSITTGRVWLSHKIALQSHVWIASTLGVGWPGTRLVGWHSCSSDGCGRKLSVETNSFLKGMVPGGVGFLSLLPVLVVEYRLPQGKRSHQQPWSQGTRANQARVKLRIALEALSQGWPNQAVTRLRSVHFSH